MAEITIRTETEDDESAVATVLERAFGQVDEVRLVSQLRIDGDVAISLVAAAGSEIVGHIMLSGMVAPFRALGLAPLSVVPERQQKGIGRSLVEEGFKRAREQGWEAVFVLGDPGYYTRFGFRLDLAQGFSSPYTGPHFMALPLGLQLPASSGRLDYAPAFASLS
jgi:putative acetyltransferase